MIGKQGNLHSILTIFCFLKCCWHCNNWESLNDITTPWGGEWTTWLNKAKSSATGGLILKGFSDMKDFPNGATLVINDLWSVLYDTNEWETKWLITIGIQRIVNFLTQNNRHGQYFKPKLRHPVTKLIFI